MRLAILFISTLLLSNCAMLDKVAPDNDVSQLYLDQHFPDNSHIATMNEIFAVSTEMEAYVEQRLNSLDTLEDKVNTLLHDLFSEQYMAIEYKHGANFIASETFEQRAANCMSLTLLSYVLAEQAGLDAKFMQVEVTENWNVSSRFTQLNGHVNLEVSLSDFARTVFHLTKSSYVIDFLPMLNAKSKGKVPLSKKQIVALYYNNKGAEALYQDRANLAYRYFKQASLYAPEFASVWGNLASLYRQHNLLDKAEQVYMHALAIEPNNLNIQDNLALLYRKTNRHQQAQALMAKVRKQRTSNPYYYAMQGEEALRQQQAEQAAKLFRKAIKLERKEHSFYFGLARAYLSLGQYQKADQYLKKALQLSPDQSQKRQYQNKRSALSSLLANNIL